MSTKGLLIRLAGNQKPMGKPQLRVHEIINQEGIIKGLVLNDIAVVQNLEVVLGSDKTKLFIQKASEQVQAVTIFLRFHQFLLETRNQGEAGLSMQIIDFQENIDLIINYYKKLEGNEWNKKSRDIITNIALDIINKPTPINAELKKVPLTI